MSLAAVVRGAVFAMAEQMLDGAERMLDEHEGRILGAANPGAAQSARLNGLTELQLHARDVKVGSASA